MIKLNLTKTFMAIEDYLILPVVFTESTDSVKHYLYIKQNVPKFPLQNDERTIFVANLPADTTESHLKTIFKSLGGRTEKIIIHASQDSARHVEPEDISLELDEIEDETFSKEVKRLKRLSALPPIWKRDLLISGSNAHVTFIETVELEVVLRTIRKTDSILWDNTLADQKQGPVGNQRYKQHLIDRYPNVEALQESVDTYMELFNKEEILKKRKQKLMRSVPDEDGFVTITRGGRSGAGRAADALKLAEKAKTRGIVSDLYRFQRRDEHKAKMNEIKMKFEDDKRKINELKARRQFMT